MARTPWGPPQGGTLYPSGIVAHSAAGHGDFKLSVERNGPVRAASGW
jgi:hypothetical protein